MRKQKCNGKKEWRPKKELPISNALDSNGVFFKFQYIKAFGKLELSFLVK